MKTFNLLFVLSLFVFASCETAEFVEVIGEETEPRHFDLKRIAIII